MVISRTHWRQREKNALIPNVSLLEGS